MSKELESLLADFHLIGRFDVPLCGLCHWRIGGLADCLVEPRNGEEVRLARDIARQLGLPVLVIGHGSNVLFDDRGFRGMIIKIGSSFSRCSFDGNSVKVEGGLWAPSLARACASRGLSGLEHVVGIPGNLGGLLFMNGGSLRKNIGDVVKSVMALKPDGEMSKFSQADCGFTYRHSVFQDNGAIILGAILELVPSSPEAVRQEMLAILEERRGKFPLDLPNCGSVFSNEADLYAAYGPPGMIIDKAGLKGLRVGGAQVSARHANFIVNLGGASSADIFVLVRQIRRKIFDITGFTLHCEVRYVSPDGGCGRLDQFL